jgi:peptidoglycan/xylan/chitin deacetylase (PgdA/CDA1 family)
VEFSIQQGESMMHTGSFTSSLKLCVALTALTVACESEDTAQQGNEQPTEQQTPAVVVDTWTAPQDRTKWTVFSPTGTAHDFRVSGGEITLDGTLGTLGRSSSCTKERREIDGPLNVTGTAEITLSPGDKWGSVVLNYFGSNGKILDGADRFSFVTISKTTATTPFNAEITPPERATHYQLCVGLKAKQGSVKVQGLTILSATEKVPTRPLLAVNLDPSEFDESASLVVLGQDHVEAHVITKRNKTRKDHDLVLYTPDHGPNSGQTRNGIEVAVDGGLVSAVRLWGVQKPLPIPKNGYLLSGNGSSASFLKRFNVGDPIRVQEESMCSAQQQSIPVLMYHRLFHEGSKDIIDSQFREMHEAGYSSISMDELAAVMQGKRVNLPDKPIVLTFDDGRREHYTELPAMMERYDLKAVLFGIGKQLDQPLDRYFGWSEAKELIATGRFEMQCHSYDAHRHIVGESGKKAGAYRTPAKDADGHGHAKFRRADLQACKAAYDANLEIENHHIAWPFGEYDESLVEMAEAEGFVSMTTTQEGINGSGMSTKAIRRFSVGPEMYWSDVKQKIDAWRICPVPEVMASL